jgi:hypothetical protein
MKHTDVLDVVKRFTISNPGVAVKAVSPTERSAVCVNGEEKVEHAAELMPVLEPEESAPVLEPAGYVATTFYLGKWDEQDARFVPDSEPLTWPEFSARAEGKLE